MIDIAQLKRDVAAAEGNLMVITRDWAEGLIVELESGTKARVKLAHMIATGNAGAEMVAGLAR